MAQPPETLDDLFFEPLPSYNHRRCKSTGVFIDRLGALAPDCYTSALYGDNVTDEEYRTMAQANATGIGAGRGTPATMGISIRAKF